MRMFPCFSVKLTRYKTMPSTPQSALQGSAKPWCGQASLAAATTLLRRVGGSAETHERMQDTAVRFEEALKGTGRPLSATPPEKAVDLLRKAMDR